MKRTHNPTSETNRPMPRRAGFTFTEIMFAVILLGIGFIMLAGMFPVAIQQTRSAVEDTTAAAVAQTAVRHLQQVWTYEKLVCSDQGAALDDVPLVWSVMDRADSTSLKDEGTGRSKTELQDGLYELSDRCRGSAIHAQDPRYAWTALYRRGGNADFPAGYVQAIVIVLEARGKQFFDQKDVEAGNLQPRAVQITELRAGDPQEGTSDTIRFNFNHGDAKKDCVAEGSFVIIAGNETGTKTPQELIGRIYRLGSPIGANGQPARYNLAAAYGLTGATYNDRKTQELTSSTRAYVVGRSIDLDKWTSSASTVDFTGPAMDIGVFTTYLSLKQEQ